MRGCLSLPFRLLALGLLIAAVIVGWSHREEIRRRIHAWSGPRQGGPGEGWGDPGRGSEVRARISGLGAGRDSVMLTPPDLASLIAAEAARSAPGIADSVMVRLDRDDAEVRAWIATGSLRLGPAAPVLREREWVEAGGRITYRRPGVAEWEIERARVRGIPVPRSAVQALLRQVSGGGSGADAVIEIPLPAPVTGLRAGPAGLVLYGSRVR